MQHLLLPIVDPAPGAPSDHAPIGVQKDIHYFGTDAKRLLNGPESTGMGFWSINPYIGCAFGCAYCYARYAHQYVVERTTAATADDGYRAELTELPPWLAFERRIFVKLNAASVLKRELASRPSVVRQEPPDGRRRRRHGISGVFNGELVLIGTATDPYQPAERRFRVTRAILEVLARERGLRIGITTKSPLITRDIDLLRRIARDSSVRVHVSLITVDRDLARRVEPRAPTPEARLRAIARLAAAGIETGINVMPVLPGLTDRPEMLDQLVRSVAEAGASHVNACALRLQSSARRRYLPFIAQEFPQVAAQYRSAYASSYQVSERYREGLSRFMRARCAKYGIRYGTESKVDFVRTNASADDGREAVLERFALSPNSTSDTTGVTEPSTQFELGFA